MPFIIVLQLNSINGLVLQFDVGRLFWPTARLDIGLCSVLPLARRTANNANHLSRQYPSTCLPSLRV